MNEKEEKILRGRLRDLARKSYEQNIFTFTDFLGLSGQSVFDSMKKELNMVPFKIFGGYKDAERVVVRFGSEETFGYEVNYPISCLEIVPLDEKRAEKLGHRDILGSLMNLGIDRGLIGDILIKNEGYYIFCKESLVPFLDENLTRIRHTGVYIKIYEGSLKEFGPNLKRESVQVASERVDGVISKVFRISRDESLSLFKSGKVFINGRETTGNAKIPKEGDIVSVRGFGRFKYCGQTKTTRKGNLLIEVEIFI